MRIISTKQLMLFSMLIMLSGSIFGQSTLQGVVTDSLSHEALIGASVVLVGTSQGSATNLDGEYKITNIAAGTYKIRVSYVGYETKTINFTFSGDKSIELFIELSTRRIEGKTITVTAQAQGQLAAINEQLSSDKIVNIVSAEKMKELPDANIAESIGRLPGVSLGRTAGEADKVIIRGLSAQFNKVTIEGVPMVSTSQGHAGGNTNLGTSNYSDRSIDLSMLSDDLVKGVELSKSLRANMDADAIGGTINLTLKEAPKGLHYDIQSSGGYNALTKGWKNYKLNGSISDRFFDDIIGVRLQLSDEDKALPSQQFNGGYDGVAAQSSKDPITGLPVLSYIRNTNSSRLTVDNLDRKRYGGSLILDFESDFVDLLFLNTYNQKKDHDEQYNNSINFESSGADLFSKYYAISDYKTEERTHSLQAKFKIYGTELNLSGSYTKGNTSNPGYDFPFTQVTTPSLFKPSDYIFKDPALLMAKTIGYENPKNFILRNIDKTNNFLNDNDYDLKVDYIVPFKFSDDLSGKFSAGAKYHELERDNQGTSLYYNMEWGGMKAHQNEMQAWLTTMGVPNALGGDPNRGGSSGMNFMDPSYSPPSFLNGRYTLDSWGYSLPFLNYLAGKHYQKFGTEYYTDGVQTYNSIYNGAEKLLAGYVMGEFNIGTDLSIVPGVRYEEVRTTYGAYAVSTNNSNQNGLAGSAPIWRSINNKVMNYFPSVNAKYKASENIQLMGAYYSSVARPNFSDVSPLIDYGTNGNISASSNPYLKPAVAQNFDLGASLFSNTIGLFSVNLFYKQIKDLVYAIPSYLPYKKGDIVHAPSDILSRLPGYNYLDSVWISKNQAATTSMPINNPETAYIRGIELSWQTHLWYLPGVLSGIVLDLNLSLMNSQTYYPYFDQASAPKDTIFKADGKTIKKIDYYQDYKTRKGSVLNQPKAIYNAIIGWDYMGFSTRVSFRYQQTTLTGIDSKFSLADTYYDNVLLVDISAKQKVIDNLAVFVNFTNIGSHIDDYYYSSPNGKLPTSSQTYGFNAQFGVSFSY